MKAAFLIRCSTKKQDYERQVKDLTRLAKRLGYEYGESTIYGEHITGKDDATKKDRLYQSDIGLDLFATHALEASEYWHTQRQWFDHTWKAGQNK